MKALYDRFASSEDGAQMLASARLRREVLRALQRALEACGLTQSQLAERLHFRKSAVNQVFRGDGNLRVNTIAHYLSAMGYELDIRVVEAGEPRKAVLEGREMVPAIRQDWIEFEPGIYSVASVQSDGTSREDFLQQMVTGPIEVQFVPSSLSATLVEMRMGTSVVAGGALYGFEGAAEVMNPDILPDQDFQPIRSGAAS